MTKRKNDESLLRPAYRPFEPQAEASPREHAELLNLTLSSQDGTTLTVRFELRPYQ